MKKKKWIFWGVGILFIVLNMVLVAQDEDGKVARISYIKNWTEVKQADMYEKLATDGILDYMDKHFIYLDDNAGTFEEFLVEEGDTVNYGDSLYTYQVEHYNEMKMNLDHEVERLESEIEAVEDAIKKMTSKNIRQQSTRFVYPDDTVAATVPQNTTSADMLKEGYIIEKEKELGQLEAQLESVEAQLTDLTAGEGIITVESPYYGKVTKISKTLNNPVMTVESHDLYVTGELTEQERMAVEEGMEVEIALVENDADTLQGLVSNVSEEPKNVTLKGASIYPFEVTFDEESEDEFNELTDLEFDEETEEELDLLQGYHANLEITLKESLDAVVVNEKAVFDSKLWRMTSSGMLVEQPVKQGIEMENLVEVTEGAKRKDWVAVAEADKFYDGAIFITPLKPSKATWKEIYNEAPRKRSVLIGLLGR